ncbi:hypothetical protein MGG_15819 [Pyricularia oryzae 70-15]|uniref:Uncharacterized protein n=2 Tax=Pyricularia oryzae TaxID=318829 RepID=G4MYD2_PYRO7|nr:uncharacterized protein MGG_15819 [Pyricularia oryzae 70-15]EHA55267.1 hypothetical protein MGG_15819 [Pyricularia oryzae 70-15]ELQ44240.1 hypothetical protein OOU_Y34scaffold00094g30 [Pyricularia oryzae Y34]
MHACKASKKKLAEDKVSKQQFTVVEPGQFKEEKPILTGIRVYASPKVVVFFMDLVPARPIRKFERVPECRQRQWRITVSSTWSG